MCGWVPHPQNNENCIKEEKGDERVLKKNICIKIIASSKRAIKEKKSCFWNYAPLFFLYLFQKLKSSKIFLPLP